MPMGPFLTDTSTHAHRQLRALGGMCGRACHRRQLTANGTSIGHYPTLSQNIAQNEPEKKMPSTAANATCSDQGLAERGQGHHTCHPQRVDDWLPTGQTSSATSLESDGRAHIE